MLTWLLLLVEPLSCRVDAISAMVRFQETYRSVVTEDVADIRFVPGGSQRAMTYVDPRTKRLTTMVNVASMTTNCPETIELMARHEACHVIYDAERLAEERLIEPPERHRMEMRAGMCALLVKQEPE